ncbi:MAG: PH domain-containing protein [Pirellulales bacterium]
MKCPVCHVEAPQGASFCQQCGARLPMFDEMSTKAQATDPPETVVRSSQSSEAADSKQQAATSGEPKRGIRDVPEETLWEGTYSPKAMLGLAVGCALLSIVLLVLALGYASGWFRWILLLAIVAVWVAAAVRLAVKRLGIRYKLTTHMFYHQRGVLTRVTDRIELIEIHDVTWEQGLFDRLVNVGKIKIESSDRTDPVFFLTGVEDVENVAQTIDKARRGEQVRRGRRIDFSHIDGET